MKNGKENCNNLFRISSHTVMKEACNTHVDWARFRSEDPHADAYPSGGYAPNNVPSQDDDDKPQQVSAEDYTKSRPRMISVIPRRTWGGRSVR